MGGENRQGSELDAPPDALDQAQVTEVVDDRRAAERVARIATSVVFMGGRGGAVGQDRKG